MVDGMENAPICFVDVETISLERDHRHVWDVGLIYPENGVWKERSWLLADVPIGESDPRALEIGQFFNRHGGAHTGTPRDRFAHDFSKLTWGLHLVGAIPSFDEERLYRLLRANNACPGWHYHIIDIEAMLVGYLAAQARIDARPELLELATPPYRSEDLSRAVGVDPDQFDRHTGLGDCRWTKAMYEAVL
jgi:hypothetical protein